MLSKHSFPTVCQLLSSSIHNFCCMADASGPAGKCLSLKTGSPRLARQKRNQRHRSALFPITILEQYSLMPKQVILLRLEKAFINTCKSSEQTPTMPASEALLIMMLASMQSNSEFCHFKCLTSCTCNLWLGQMRRQIFIYNHGLKLKVQLKSILTYT